MKAIKSGLAMTPVCAAMALGAEPIEIGSRLELFVDEFMVQELKGEARLQMHRPVRREIVLRTDTPWEGNGSAYQSVFRDGDRLRMYYRGGHHVASKAYETDKISWNTLCLAESTDGIHWTRPELGIVEFRGSKQNNLILDSQMVSEVGGSPAHTAVFKDENPNCPPEELYKIVMYGSKPRGLYLLVSGDGAHFRLKSPKAFMSTGAFDSQNLAFWDSARGEYRLYHRGFNKGVRDILTCAAPDFDSFPEPEWVTYPGSPTMALYTNQIQPYYRAPHIFMGFPMRYNERGWSGPMLDLPGRENRLERGKHHPRYGMTVTDAVFMTSRDGLHFSRRPEAFIRPGPRQKESWVYGDNFIFWGMYETPSLVEDAHPEINFLAVEGYWEDADTAVRRYTMRIDGFVSAYAPYAGGELVTKPFVFKGGSLAINAETSGFGSFQVELQNVDGTPVRGFELEACEPIFCDSLQHIVHWDNICDVSALAGQPVRLRFLLRDADIYSFQFVPTRPARVIPKITGIGIIPAKNARRESFVVLEDDFQNAEPGGLPHIGDGDSGWQIRRARPDLARVLSEGENHYLEVKRETGGMSKGARAWVTMLPQDAADTTDGIVEVSARLRVPSANAFCVDIDAYDNPPEEYKNRAFHTRFWPNGKVSHYARPKSTKVEKQHDPEEWTKTQRIDIPELSFEPDTWFDVVIRADMKAATFDLTVNGKTVKGLAFAHQRIRRIQAIAFCPNTDNCTIHIDNVRVEIKP